MTIENRVDLLLDSKPSYLKCGPVRIANALGLDERDTNVVDIVRQAKKDFKKYGGIPTRNTGRVKRVEPEVIIPVAKIPEGFEEKFIEMAKALGYAPISKSPASASKITAEVNNFKTTKKSTIKSPPSIPNQVGMHILIGCNHVPFHNVEMHNGLIELIKDHKKQIKGFHLMGDFMDLNTLSFHDRGKFTSVPGLTLDQEYRAGNSLLDEFDAVLPKKAWKTYLYGNHEDRWNRWMHSTDNAKTPLMSPKNALSLDSRGYQTKENWSRDFFTIGKHLDIMHGIYFSIHCAKAHLDKLRGSCAFVHTHRIQSYIEGNTGSFNLGAGADFTSPAFNYATRPMKASWQNGFAIVMVDEDGSYHLTQIICRNGKFYFGGKEY